MGKRLIQILSFLSFLALIYSTEYDVEHYEDQGVYDLTRLISKAMRNVHNSKRLEELKPLENLKFSSVGENVEPLLSKFTVQNTSKCAQDLAYIISHIKSKPVLKMIDSFGKPESGILNGNFKWVGDYNECVGIRVSNPFFAWGNFKGKYCSLTWDLKPLNLSLPFTFVSGLCIPDSCSPDEFQEDALEFLSIAGVIPDLDYSNYTVNSTLLKCKPTEVPLSAAAKSMIALLSIFYTLTVLGSSLTIVKYFMKIVKESTHSLPGGNVHANNQVKGEANDMEYKHGLPDDEALLQDAITIRVPVLQKLETFFECFCVFKNGAKLLNTNTSEGELLCIHGIRFLSMSWVILGHTYVFGYGEIRNMLELFTLIDSFPFQAILQAFYSVDSFFVLSGFLLAFLSMKEFSKTKGKISWPYFYFHRYLRLTPMYMILLGFSASLYFYLGSGPYWPDDYYDPGCRDIWWKNLLYINNFDDKKQCMGWSWYLANDMQFFIISPLFLITLWRWPKIGCFVLGIFLLASILCNFIITYKFDLMSGLITLVNDGIGDMTAAMAKFTDYFTKLYIKPYTRIGPYLVGLFTGFILFKRKASNAPKHSLLFLTAGWIIASSITLVTVYGLYHAHPDLIARSFYNAFSRIAFASGLSWVIYVCLIGQGGFINSLLSFKLFIPLSRLTYAAYLIHPIVISGYLMSLRTSLEFSHPTIVVLFLGIMLITYALSLPVALILESPIVALEKLIRKKFTTERKTDTVN